jgi:hypothetical protein
MVERLFQFRRQGVEVNALVERSYAAVQRLILKKPAWAFFRWR